MGVAARTRTAFHRLPLAGVEPLTEDALCLTFAVPAGLREVFAFRAGQHVTLRCEIGGAEIRRSYSVCSTPAQLRARGVLRVGVRRLAGGAFSTYAAALGIGDEVSVLPPMGHFTSAFAADRSRHYAAVAAGSGITPVLSLLATALAVEPTSRFTVVSANRTSTSVMFLEELADLKDRYPDRLHLIHVLSREARDSELLSGRLDGARFARLLDALLPVRSVDEWFLCGPYGLVSGARAVLAERAVPATSVRAEYFHVEEQPIPRQTRGAGPDGARLTVALDGRATTVVMHAGERVLDAALRVRPELPYACKGGVCATCRARLVEGRVEMARNYALEPDELAAGYVLTCQSSPRSAQLRVDYDA
ncbi:MAG TPA: 1,2-phenylacetyl-CoA epoxidase subunit PaaE [Micromonosporaceae bacterium]|nr:1,2-phenylacetyl-CoA epoxidase subunit PaaE [Micromonosporaceae bacterium]